MVSNGFHFGWIGRRDDSVWKRAIRPLWIAFSGDWMGMHCKKTTTVVVTETAPPCTCSSLEWILQKSFIRVNNNHFIFLEWNGKGNGKVLVSWEWWHIIIYDID